MMTDLIHPHYMSRHAKRETCKERERASAGTYLEGMVQSHTHTYKPTHGTPNQDVYALYRYTHTHIYISHIYIYI